MLVFFLRFFFNNAVLFSDDEVAYGDVPQMNPGAPVGVVGVGAIAAVALRRSARRLLEVSVFFFVYFRLTFFFCVFSVDLKLFLACIFLFFFRTEYRLCNFFKGGLNAFACECG